MGGSERRRGRFPRAIYVRASEAEKLDIYRKAGEAQLSASRFLVRAGLDGRPPPTDAERRELERLLRLFLRGHRALSRLLADFRTLRAFGADAELERELQEALNALAALVHHVRKRLSEGG